MSPRKERKALDELHKAGWLTRERHQAVEMAAESSPPREGELLLFAAALAHLERRRQVPVIDTIRMALTADRRLNLGWSERRWRDEHDSLTRQLTANKRREQATIPFETGWLKDVLGAAPEDSDIKLFSSSADLIDESEIQRHCIASYSGRFQIGEIGGLSLVLNGERWTVTIRPPIPGGTATAAVHGICGRRNRVPSASSRCRILRALGPRVADAREAVPTMQHTPRTDANVYLLRRRGPFAGIF